MQENITEQERQALITKLCKEMSDLYDTWLEHMITVHGASSKAEAMKMIKAYEEAHPHPLLESK